MHRNGDSSRFKMVDITIFYFENLEIIVRKFWRTDVCLVQNLNILCKTIAKLPQYFDFQDDGCHGSVKILNFIGPPVKNTWWSLTLCKIWL